MGSLLQDLERALRRLCGDQAFAVIALSPLAPGCGAVPRGWIFDFIGPDATPLVPLPDATPWLSTNNTITN